MQAFVIELDVTPFFGSDSHESLFAASLGWQEDYEHHVKTKTTAFAGTNNSQNSGCRPDPELNLTAATCHRWRNHFDGLEAEDAKKLKHLEKQDPQFMKLLAWAELEKAVLKELAEVVV